MEKFDYLPESTRNAAEHVEDLLEEVAGAQTLFRALLKQAYQDGKDAKTKEYAKMARDNWEEELRKPPRL